MSTPITQNHPLHFAARNGQKSIVELLLRSGADPSIPNSHGLIPAELTKDKNISALLMRTNWISQRPKQYDESLEMLLQNMAIVRTSPEKASVSSNDITTLENESKNKKSISIAIPDTKSELNLPIQGYSKIVEKLPERREKPSRRYSLPAGSSRSYFDDISRTSCH